MPDASPPHSPDTRHALKWAIFLGFTALVIYACALILGPFVNVIAWSAVLAITFYPVHRQLVRRTGRASLSAFICSVLVVIAIVIPLTFVIGIAIDQFLGLRDYLERVSATGEPVPGVEPLRRAAEWVLNRLGLDAPSAMAWIRQHANDFARASAEYSLRIAANVTNLAVSFIFTIFAMFLLFRDGERIVARITDLLPFERSRSEAMLIHIRDVIYGSVYGVVVIALLQGALCGGMFWLLGVPSAALWGSITVLTSVVPVVGAAAVWGPGAIYLALTGAWVEAVVLAAWGALVISAVDNFIRPKLVGGRVGLSELAMFFALLGGLQVFGVLGIVMGPVLFAIAASIVDVLSDRSAVTRQAETTSRANSATEA